MKNQDFIKHLNQSTDHELVISSSKENTFEIDFNVPEERDQFELDPLFSDHMVLQANRTITISGRYKTDGPIAVVFAHKTFFSEVHEGIFTFELGEFPYGEPFELELYTKQSKYVLHDIYIGEVYVMSGQSNMAITLNQIREHANHYYQDKIVQDKDLIHSDHIRFFQVCAYGTGEGQNEFHCNERPKWSILNSSNYLDISATAFYFAQELMDLFPVPIGLVLAAVGATITSTWIPNEEAKTIDQTYIKNETDSDTPSRFYNGMIYPLRTFRFAGVIWYQGEGQHVHYKENMEKLIYGWRKDFNDPSLKFLIIELPRIDFDMGYTKDSWFEVRKQQKELSGLTNVFYSVSIDFGIKESETNDPMHPFDKDLIGKRAAHACIKYFYNKHGIWSSPELKLIRYKDDKVIIELNEVGESIILKSLKAGFEVSNDGSTFYYAEPKIVGKTTIELKSKIKGIIKVLYGYTYQVKEVFGGDGYPPKLSDLVCVYNSEGYPLDQFWIKL